MALVVSWQPATAKARVDHSPVQVGLLVNKVTIGFSVSTPVKSFHQGSVLIRASFTDAVQSRKLTALLNNTLKK